MLGNPDNLQPEIQQAICFSPLIIHPDCSIREALALLISETETNDTASKVNWVWVVAQKQLLGIITAKQILSCWGKRNELENLSVKSLMLSPEPTIDYSQLQSLAQIWEIFKTRNVTEIPVIDDNSEELVGILKRDWLCQQISFDRASAINLRQDSPNQTAIAQRRTEYLNRQLQSEQFLNSLCEQIRSSLNVQTILDITTQQIRQFLNCDRAFIYQIYKNRNAQVRSQASIQPNHLLQTCQIPEFYPSPEWCQRYHQFQVQVINDVCSELSATSQQSFLNFEIRASMIVPIICRGKVWSLLMVSQRDTPRHWRDEDIDIVKRVARQCAIALEQAITDRNLRREVKKRQQAQRELENRQAQLLDIANSLPGGIYQFVVTPDGKWSFPFANQGALALFGIPSNLDPSQASHWFERIHPEDVQEVETKTQAAISQQTRWQCEFRVSNEEGIRWVQGIANTPSQAENGNIVFNGVVLDITERKNAEKGWRTLVEATKNVSSENFFASVVEYIANALQVSWVLLYRKQKQELQSIAVWGNGQWQPNLTISEQEYTPCAVALRHGGLAYPEKLQEHFPNNPLLESIGAEGYISVPLSNLSKEVIGHLCIIHDQPLTDINRLKLILDVLADRIAVELERTEALANLEALNADLENQVAIRTADLEKRNEELDHFFSVSLDLLCIATIQGYFTRLNQRWEEILGYSLAELEGCYFLNLVHPEDREATHNTIAQLARGESVPYFVNRYCCADGSYRWLEWGAVPCGDKIYAAAHDITQRKQTQEYLQQTNAELEQANQLKDKFLANMSHELRTPLNSILGITEGLQEQVYGSLNQKQLQSVNTIQRSGNHLLDLINDILDLSKIESGKLELHLENLSIQHLCRSTLALVREMAHKQQIALHLELPAKLPTIQADEQRLRQALLNLLSNAIKFTPEQGTVTLKVEWVNQNSEIAFSVIDTGVGIAEENLATLFDPFVQVQTQINRELKGTGLGLSLVKRLAHLHGGEVTVSSQVGEGSHFTITIPYYPSQETEQSLETSTDNYATGAENSAGARLPKILIADDDEANVLTTCSYLEAKGYSIVVAKNGRDAIAQALQEQPDMILMDIQMPELDGLEAIRQLRAEPNAVKIPIIALTAFAMSGDREKCLDAGADQYVAKPVRLRELVNTINQTISLS